MRLDTAPGPASAFAFLQERAEILVTLLGLLLFLLMSTSNGRRLAPLPAVVLGSIALVHAAIALTGSMRLPSREPQPIDSRGLARSALGVAAVVVVGAVVLSLLHGTMRGERRGRMGLGFAAPVFLGIVALGTLGLAAARTLAVELFPEFRRPTVRRVLYAVAAAPFLALLSQFWGGLCRSLAQAVAARLGEAPDSTREAAQLFDPGHPLALLAALLIGAGLFEELIFRVGIMTPVWAASRSWVLGLMISALAFGLYHISPVSGVGVHNLRTPVTAVLTSAGMGLANGVVYRFRGVLAVLLMHALGDWLAILLLARSGT